MQSLIDRVVSKYSSKVNVPFAQEPGLIREASEELERGGVIVPITQRESLELLVEYLKRAREWYDFEPTSARVPSVGNDLFVYPGLTKLARSMSDRKLFETFRFLQMHSHTYTSRDHLLRIIDEVVSPDGEYFVAPSEFGTKIVWISGNHKEEFLPVELEDALDNGDFQTLQGPADLKTLYKLLSVLHPQTYVSLGKIPLSAQSVKDTRSLYRKVIETIHEREKQDSLVVRFTEEYSHLNTSLS